MEPIGNAMVLHRTAAVLADVLDATIVAGTWLVVEDAGDIDINDTESEGDASRRRHGGNKATVGTSRDCTITATFIVDRSIVDSLADFEAFETAYQAKTPIGLAAVSAAIATSGANGFVGNFTITGFVENQPIDGIVTFTITFRLYGHGKRYKKV